MRPGRPEDNTFIAPTHTLRDNIVLVLSMLVFYVRPLQTATTEVVKRPEGPRVCINNDR